MAIQKLPKKTTSTAADTAVDNFINAAPDAKAAIKKGAVKGRKQQITITMDPDLIERIDLAASENGQSRAAFINMSCINTLENGLQIAGKRKKQIDIT